MALSPEVSEAIDVFVPILLDKLLKHLEQEAKAGKEGQK